MFAVAEPALNGEYQTGFKTLRKVPMLPIQAKGPFRA